MVNFQSKSITKNGMIEITTFPYRITILQELKQPNKPKRVKLWLLNFIHDCYSILDTCFFDNEAWFYLTGFINSHNYRVWSGENPHEYCESALHPPKNSDVVWCVQEKNCGTNFFHINNYWGCLPGYYSTVCVPAREISAWKLVAAGQY